jgi:hypothetical protein
MVYVAPSIHANFYHPIMQYCQQIKANPIPLATGVSVGTCLAASTILCCYNRSKTNVSLLLLSLYFADWAYRPNREKT